MRSFLLLGFLARLIAGQGCGQVCELDASGQRLTFPSAVVTSTVIATTASIITYQDAKGSIIVQTTTTTADLPPKPTLTWEVSGVTLTFPTTYVIYTDFVHSFVATKTVGGALSCSTGSADLELGTSTDFSSLIFPASAIDGTLPPTALVGYLESIPTVLAQLGGAVNSSCDPTGTTSSSVSGPTQTLTTTNTQTSVTTVFTTTSVTGEFQSMSGSVLTVPATTPPFANGTTTTRAPPPPPTSTTPTSTTQSTSSTSTSTSTVTSSSTVTSTSSATLTFTSTFSSSSVSSSSSSTSLSPTTTTTGTSTTALSSVTETFTSTSTPSGGALTTVTFTGAISSLESSPPGNFTATSPSSTSIQLANDGNQVYVGTGGWLASILGFAIYWL